MSVTAVVKCPRYFWHDDNSICPVCGYDIPIDSGATCHENMETAKVSLCFPSED